MSQKIPSPRAIRRAFQRKDAKAARQASRKPDFRTPPGTSPAQQSANQANAQLSTGPTSPEGKATVSQNRRTHGLNCSAETFTVLPCESQPDFNRLLQTLRDEQDPQDTLEDLLVDGLAQHRWLAQRALRLQETCLDPQTAQITDQKLFALYLRYATTHERAFHKCLADLHKLKKQRLQQQIGFESQTRAVEKHQLTQQALELDNLIRTLEVDTSQYHLIRAEAEAKSAMRVANAA